MISQKTKTQIAHAYGFKHKGMFLKLLEMEEINLPEHGLLNQDVQIDLYAWLSIPKGLDEKEKTVLLPLVEAYRTKHHLPSDAGFLLPRTREEVAQAYGYRCTRTFTRYLKKNDIDLPSHKLLDHHTQIDLYARMGLPKGLEAEDTKVATMTVEKYCKKRGLPPPSYYNKLNMSKTFAICPIF